MPVSYLPTDQETRERYGNVRINLFEDGSFPKDSSDQPDHDGLFKRSDRPKSSLISMRTGHIRPLPISFPEAEVTLRSPFLFKTVKRHVEGYFLANGKNEIQMSVCYIWEGHKPEILRGLIRECLLRSLGFPDPAYPLSGILSEELSMLGSWNGSTDPLPKFSEYLHKPFSLTDADRFFLSLLYNPKIKAGMDYMTVRKLLEYEVKK